MPGRLAKSTEKRTVVVIVKSAPTVFIDQPQHVGYNIEHVLQLVSDNVPSTLILGIVIVIIAFVDYLSNHFTAWLCREKVIGMEWRLRMVCRPVAGGWADHFLSLFFFLLLLLPRILFPLCPM